MTIRNRKISQVRLEKDNVDAPTINRALDNIINTVNPWVGEATETINRLESEIEDIVASSGVTIAPENASSIAGSQLAFSGSGGISYSSNGSDTLTINQQPVTVIANGTAGSGQGNTLTFNGSGDTTVTRSGTTITISSSTPPPTITFAVSGSNTISGNSFQLSGSGGISLTGTAPNTLTIDASNVSPTGPAGGVLGYAGSTYPNPSGLNPPTQNPYGSLIPNKIPIRSYGDGNRTQFIPDQQSTSYTNNGCGIEINGGLGNTTSPFPAPNQIASNGGDAILQGGDGSPNIGGNGGDAYVIGGDGVYGGSSFFGFGGKGGNVELLGGNGGNNTGVGAFAKNGGDVKLNGGVRSGPGGAGLDGNVIIANLRGDVLVGSATSTTTVSGNLIAPLITGSNITASTNIIAPTITGSYITASTNIISPAITGSEITSSQFIGWANKTIKPYGSFYDTTIQTASATPNTALAMKFDTTDAAIGFSIVSGSRITAHYDGVYNLQFSAQLDKTDSGTDEVSIWFRKDGTNLSQSNTEYTMLGNNAKQVAALNYIIQLNSGSYAEIMWYSDDTDIRLFAQTSQSLPDRPATPSVIATITQV